jgi:transcriptional regulator with XRE-family HTH domain
MLTPEQLRLECGFDLSQLAELSGVSAPSVANIERGITKRLRGVTLQKIARVVRDHLAATEGGRKITIAEYIEICIAMRDKKLNERTEAERLTRCANARRPRSDS